MPRAGRFFIDLGGTVLNLGAIRWGFRAPALAYENIAADLGVNLVNDDNRTGIVYGVNQPRPARVRIAYHEPEDNPLDPLGTDAGPGRSAIRFCEPDQLNNVLFGSINAKQIRVSSTLYDIDNVTIK